MCVPTRTIESPRLVRAADAFVAEGGACERQREHITFVDDSHNGGQEIGTKEEHLCLKKCLRGQKISTTLPDPTYVMSKKPTVRP